MPDDIAVRAEQAGLAGFLKQIKLDGATRAKILLTSRRDEQAWLGGIPQRVKMPRMSGVLATAGYLIPGLARMLRPALSRKGKRIKEKYRRRAERDA